MKVQGKDQGGIRMHSGSFMRSNIECGCQYLGTKEFFFLGYEVSMWHVSILGNTVPSWQEFKKLKFSTAFCYIACKAGANIFANILAHKMKLKPDIDKNIQA